MLLQTIGEILTFAVVISISPIPIVGVVLMLATPRGKVNGPAFLMGWVLALATVGTVVVFAMGGAASEDEGGTATWVSFGQIGLGVVLLVLAVKQFQGRPRAGEDPPMPAWMATIDAFTAPKSFGFGILLAGVNPKNLLLIVAAGSTIAGAGLDAGDDVIAMAVFVVIATIGPAVPVAISLFAPSRAPMLLSGMKSWLGEHNAVIMAALIFLIGVKVIGQGLGGLG